MNRFFLKAVTCFVSLLVLGSSLHADVTGSIFGAVTDPSGATVLNASVTLKNPDTDSIERFRPIQPAATSSSAFP